MFFFAVVFSEIPDTSCYLDPTGFDGLQPPSNTSIDEIKEICANDVTCFGFIKSKYSYIKCESSLKRRVESGQILHVKGTINGSVIF